MTDDNKGTDIFDVLDKATELYNEHKDTLRDVAPETGSVTINDEEPLKQALVDDEKVLVTVDVGEGGVENIRLNLDGTTAKVEVGGKNVTAEVPEDVNMDNASAVMNNGVLEVIIPREGGKD